MESRIKKENQVFDMSVQKATLLLYDINSSCRSYLELRLHLLDCDFEMPPRNKVDIEKGELCPEIKSQPLKSSVEMYALINQNLLALIENSKMDFENNSELYCYFKYGCDGSGSHKKRQQHPCESASHEHPHIDTENDDTSYIGTFLTPLLISKVPTAVDD